MQRDTEFITDSLLVRGHIIVGGNDIEVARDECSHHCFACDSNAIHKHAGPGHQPPTCLEKSAMNRARALATQIPEINQNRMITVVSGHPSSSKW